MKRWLFKLDDCYDGRGIGYCDIAEHLECYQWALKESRRYGEKWNKKWAQVCSFWSPSNNKPVFCTYVKHYHNRKCIVVWWMITQTLEIVKITMKKKSFSTTISISLLAGSSLHQDPCRNCWCPGKICKTSTWRAVWRLVQVLGCIFKSRWINNSIFIHFVP